jgi:hypothetical protein
MVAEEGKEGGETLGQAVGEGRGTGALLMSIEDVLAATHDEAYWDGITGCCISNLGFQRGIENVRAAMAAKAAKAASAVGAVRAVDVANADAGSASSAGGKAVAPVFVDSVALQVALLEWASLLKRIDPAPIEAAFERLGADPAMARYTHGIVVGQSRATAAAAAAVKNAKSAAKSAAKGATKGGDTSKVEGVGGGGPTQQQHVSPL